MSTEKVDHPAHYHPGRYEAIDVIEAWDLDFCLGNAVKYIARHKLKGTPREDLEKAKWYLSRAITRMYAEQRSVAPAMPEPCDYCDGATGVSGLGQYMICVGCCDALHRAPRDKTVRPRPTEAGKRRAAAREAAMVAAMERAQAT